MKERWTNQQIELLHNSDPSLTDKELTVIIKKSIYAIRRKRKRENIIKGNSSVRKRLIKENKIKVHLNPSYWKGKKRTEANKQKYSKPNNKNPMWKGNLVKYTPLHQWVRRNKIKPLVCEECRKNKPLEVANVSGKYKRDVNDYKWLCRKCHMTQDGRLDKLHVFKRM